MEEIKDNILADAIETAIRLEKTKIRQRRIIAVLVAAIIVLLIRR